MLRVYAHKSNGFLHSTVLTPASVSRQPVVGGNAQKPDNSPRPVIAARGHPHSFRLLPYCLWPVKKQRLPRRRILVRLKEIFRLHYFLEDIPWGYVLPLMHPEMLLPGPESHDG